MTSYVATPNSPAGEGPCIFCGTFTQMTGEHLFARWISKVHAEGNKSNAKLTLRMNGEEKIEEIDMTKFDRSRDIGHANLRLNILCKSCNNVWGSDIQDRCSAVIKPIMETGAWHMSNAGREHVARWAASFLIVRQYLHPELVSIGEADRRKFYETSVPLRGNPPKLRKMCAIK